MPSKEAHISKARANQSTIEYLLAGDDRQLGWVVTVAFYKALHILEAVFAADPSCPVDHTDDHQARNRLLKSTNRYRHFWENYRPLWEASLIARYLCTNEEHKTHEVFSKYMPRTKVQSLALGHYLAQIEKSAGRFLGDDFLQDRPNQSAV